MQRPIVLFLFSGLTVFLMQCQSMTLDMQKSGTLPTVDIQGVYLAEIEGAFKDVLTEHDYRFVSSSGPRLVYEKPASTMDFLAWGGLYSDDEMVERLSIYIRELGVDSFEVECQPYLVSNVGRHMEETRKISRMKSKKYQRLLNEVRDSAVGAGMGALDYSEAYDEEWAY